MERKIILFVYILSLFSIINGATDVTVDTSKTYQTIRGFGGINHPDWIADLTEAQRSKAFGNGANDL